MFLQSLLQIAINYHENLIMYEIIMKFKTTVAEHFSQVI